MMPPSAEQCIGQGLCTEMPGRPILGNLHSYTRIPVTVLGRRQVGLISELPRRVLLGNSSLRWSCSQIGLFLPVTVVAQPASGQDDEHQGQHPKAQQNAIARGPRGGK